MKFIYPIVSLLGSAFFQLFLLMVCLIVFFMGSFLAGQFIWQLFDAPELGNEWGPVFGSVAVILLYAVAWYIYWGVQMEEGKIRWFAGKVLFAVLPMLPYFFFVDPYPLEQPTMNVLHTAPELIFSFMFTGAVLLPIYSFGLYRFHFNASSRRPLALILLLVVTAPLTFYGGWMLCPVIYA